jgi:hypothetical protein
MTILIAKTATAEKDGSGHWPMSNLLDILKVQ